MHFFFTSGIGYLLLFLPPAFSQEQEEEMRVELSVRTRQTPIYLCHMVADQSSLKVSYLTALRNTLQFDLEQSGYCTVVATDEALEKIQESPANFNPLRWKKAGIDLVLKAQVIDHTLNLYAYSTKAESLKKFEGIPLKGILRSDRMQMHKLSNALLKTHFGVDGIATTRLLYSIQKTDGPPSQLGWKAEIWECDYDGKNPRQITYEDNYSITPVFIPSHPELGSSRYLYVNYKNGQPKIYYSSVNSKTGKPLISLRGNQVLPAISQQRDKIAFICDAAGRADLFLQEVGDQGQLVGKPRQLFSYPRSTQASPTFHPDGTQLAFVSDKDGTPRIYLIPANSPENRRAIPKLLTKQNRENTCPSWSPDGTKLAYSAKTSGVRQIWIYDFSTGEETQLTMGPRNKENPVWAPDSLHLVFNTTDPGHSELYLLNLNEPRPVKITTGPGKKHYPTWGTR